MEPGLENDLQHQMQIDQINFIEGQYEQYIP